MIYIHTGKHVETGPVAGS